MMPRPIPASAAARRRPHAFSLLELVLVLTIVAAGAAVAVPRYTASLTHSRVEATARQLLAEVAFASSAAAATSTAVTLTFDASEQRVVVSGLPEGFARGGVAPGRGEPWNLAAEPFGARLVSADFAGSGDLVFDAWGRAVAGGEVVIAVGPQERRLGIRAGATAAEEQR